MTAQSEREADGMAFPWYWCQNCDADFQDNGVGSLRCPECGSKNVEQSEDA